MDTPSINNLTVYVRNELRRHTPPEAIIANMAAAGWPADAVKKAIEEARSGIAAENERQPIPRRQRDHRALRAFIWFLVFAVIGFLVLAYDLGGQ